MIFRRERIRNQNRGEIEVRKLRKRRRTRSRDGNIRDRVDFLHAVVAGLSLHDPDANVIEFSYDQGVYAKVQEVWGAERS